MEYRRAQKGPTERRPWERRSGGIDANGISTLKGVRPPLRCAHVAYETTCDVVGIRQPNRTLLGENGQVQWEVGRLQASSEALVEEAPQTAAAMSGEQGLDRTLA